MRKSWVVFMALVLLTTSSQGVTTPNILVLATNIERRLKNEEPEWEMSSIRLSQNAERGHAEFIWRHNGQYVRLHLSEYSSAGKAAEDLREKLSKVDDRNARTIALTSLGDEAYFFESEPPGNPNFFVLTFRQGRVTAHVVAAETLARKFAESISKAISAA
jgi:hypothetical protein